MSNHQIVNNTQHRDLRVRADHGVELGDGVMACLTVPYEFRRVQAEFPIVFRRDLESGTFSALALFGFEEGENLFLEGDHWDATYKPLALSIQPFLVGHGPGPGAQVHVDLDHPRVTRAGNDGILLFGADGQPSPYVEAVAEQLGDLDQGYRAAGAFFATLESHALLEPFALEVPLADGSRHSLVGFHTIDEARLQSLGGEALDELHRAGHLMPLFMALASLSNFSELVARRNRKTGHG
ncbi:SapC family protein [Novosphingobium sp. B 225]|uniref:SapC family protein n=1 Tax=Novosphingobium sp. B 225 TaxID=1961849 RepID=UPI000B4AE91E|nr:SapC family protein [Novosphingobium sp. B 225]